MSATEPTMARVGGDTPTPLETSVVSDRASRRSS